MLVLDSVAERVRDVAPITPRALPPPGQDALRSSGQGAAPPAGLDRGTLAREVTGTIVRGEIGS